ncbi:condensation domain-containing protein [Actinocrispum wychmicini]|uniref:Condensation domain-containing protein n=1 Tax=Actinocrispum wychmicini TaxID=1213861 RepID=A0A4R2JXL6_9PSEU|nr:condensation domain-containing protein [Actinocrispum wychmicini]TCO61929.1 condensation domain-containing protein [Actinocrispum wychmicini]
MGDGRELSAAKQALLARWRSGQVPAAPVEITPGPPPDGPVRASIQQKELWDLYDLAPGSSSSNISYAATVNSDVDAGALATAIDQLSLRHETLRTTITFDGLAWQHIHDQPRPELETVDLSSLPPGEALAEAHRMANALAQQGFHITTPPLVRVVLYRLGPGRHLIAVVANHAVADGWSLAIAMKETTQIYDALLSAKTPDLAPLPVQYRDYARWQWQWMDSEEALRHAHYWEKVLRPVSATRLPTDFPRGANRDLRAGLAQMALSPELSAAVRRLAQAEQVSLFTVLFTAFAVLVRERTGDPLVSVGTPAVSRPHPQTLPLIGFFASVVPLCTVIEDGDTFHRLLHRVRDVASDAMTHQDFALPMYLNRVEVDRDFAHHPLYTAMFVLQPPMPAFELAGAPLKPVNLDRGEMFSNFAVHLWNTEPAIHGTIGYSTSAFRRSTIDEIIDRYLDILHHATADPARLVVHL